MKALLIALLCIVTAFSAEYPFEEDVLVITAATFPQAIAQYENLLVEFYAPWNGHCKIFSIEYAKIAQRLAETDFNVKLAKIDFTIEEELALEYEISPYPTLILFSKSLDSSPIFYEGPKTTSDIINWLKKKTSPGSVEVKTVEDAQILIANSEFLMIFFGPEGTEAENNFLKVSVGADVVTFAHSRDQTIADKFGFPFNSIVLFRRFDQGKSVLTGAISVEAIKTFINENKNPIFFAPTEKSFRKIFGESLDALILIRNDNECSQKAEEAFKSISEEIKGKLVLMILHLNGSFADNFAEDIGVKKDQLPGFVLLRASKNLRYLFEGDINVDNLRSFIHNFRDNKLKPLLKSAPVPDQIYDGYDVLIVVGKNFDKIVLNENTDVLVEFYASWDGHCKRFAPIYSALSKKFKDVQGLIIAKMDIAVNEVEGLTINHYPTIRFYPKKRKNQPIDYHDWLTLENLSNFVKEHSIIVEQFREFIPEESVEL